MEMDFDGLLQLMEMMNTVSPNDNAPEQRRLRIMLTMLKLMETRKLMESYEAQLNERGRGSSPLHLLMALKPHMTGERRHTTDVLIKVFELKQLIYRMGADIYGR